MFPPPGTVKPRGEKAPGLRVVGQTVGSIRPRDGPPVGCSLLSLSCLPLAGPVYGVRPATGTPRRSRPLDVPRKTTPAPKIARTRGPSVSLRLSSASREDRGSVPHCRAGSRRPSRRRNGPIGHAPGSTANAQVNGATAAVSPSSDRTPCVGLARGAHDARRRTATRAQRAPGRSPCTGTPRTRVARHLEPPATSATSGSCSHTARSARMPGATTPTSSWPAA
jgi:hypothetical protein